MSRYRCSLSMHGERSSYIELSLPEASKHRLSAEGLIYRTRLGPSDYHVMFACGLGFIDRILFLVPSSTARDMRSGLTGCMALHTFRGGEGNNISHVTFLHLLQIATIQCNVPHEVDLEAPLKSRDESRDRGNLHVDAVTAAAFMFQDTQELSAYFRTFRSALASCLRWEASILPGSKVDTP